MDRRKFISRSVVAGLGTLSVSKFVGESVPKKPSQAWCGPNLEKYVGSPMTMQAQQKTGVAAYQDGRFILQIAPVIVELTQKHAVCTIGYNGISPGPLLRMREGVPVTVDVSNETYVHEFIHWHGLMAPSEVDGARDEGTPFIAPHSRRRYSFVPWPAGTRWYHTHVSAGIDLYRGLYTGQFGFVYIEPKHDPGRYDQEFFLALREWEPFLYRPKKIRQGTQAGLKVAYSFCSINDKALGHGEPLRVREGQRILFHVLNASATEQRVVALPSHRFQVIALDGNPVPSPRLVDVLQLGPGERVDATVQMNQPGVWILGCTNDVDRNKGLGVVIEYAGQMGFPQWAAPPDMRWDYTKFGRAATQSVPDRTINLVFQKVPGRPNGFDNWLVNGTKRTEDIRLREGGRYRFVLHNNSDCCQPIHFHRHIFEVVDVNGRPTGGIMKDTVVVPPYGRVSVDLIADQPGSSLLCCHIQPHMDYGFKALLSTQAEGDAS